MSKISRDIKPGCKMTRKPGQDLTDAVTHLRDIGMVPWDWIVDDSRSVRAWACAPTIAEYMLKRLESASLDPWHKAIRGRPVIISESKTVGGVLARGIAQRYLVAVASTTGQCRGFLETEVAIRLRDPLTRVLYLGDADDAGDDIEANTRRVLERATGRTFKTDPGYLDLATWERLAITPEQVNDLRARGVRPILKKDRRYRDGNQHEAFECEALGQGPIERIVRDRLDQLLPEPLDDVLEREAQQSAVVHETLERLMRSDP